MSDIDMIFFFVFSSFFFSFFLDSGKLKENTGRSIEDNSKLLECGVFSLRRGAILNENSPLVSFKKLKVFGIQVIESQVTLLNFI